MIVNSMGVHTPTNNINDDKRRCITMTTNTITTTKARLTNRMKKLGDFLKVHRDDVDLIYSKIAELFPNSCEVFVYDDEPNNIYFLVGEEYTGKKPSKKEMKEVDNDFYEIDELDGIMVNIDMDDDKIELSSNISVYYTDKWRIAHSTTHTINNFEIVL